MSFSGDGKEPTAAEVLASMRRTLGGYPETTPQHAGAASTLEPVDDFELPAMFRREREAAPSATLIDRIGAALRPANGAAATALQSSVAETDDVVPREMPPICDRLMVRMGGATASSLQERASKVPRAIMGGRNFLLGEGSLFREAVSADEGDDDVDAFPALSRPPPLPEQAQSTGDAGAELLRPMLKQWLDEHMDRVLSQALQREGRA